MKLIHTVSPIFSRFSDSFLTLIYPQACQICSHSVERQADGYVCRDCWEKTKVFSRNETLCDKCGAFLLEKKIASATYCRRCDDNSYDRARAIGKYEKALLTTIINLKNTPFVPKTLSELLHQTFLDSDFQDAELMIPVPLSRERLSERGYNQAELLAQNLSQKAQIPLYTFSLNRKIHVEKRRAGMDRKSRFESVKNVFEVITPKLILGKKVLLIDDVFTSGATVSNCAEVLKQAGADKVYVLCAARA